MEQTCLRADACGTTGLSQCSTKALAMMVLSMSFSLLKKISLRDEASVLSKLSDVNLSETILSSSAKMAGLLPSS